MIALVIEHHQTDHVVTCVECRAEAPPDAFGWRAYLTAEDDDEPEDDVEVVVLCPKCAPQTRSPWRSTGTKPRSTELALARR
jgi:hypothetical protein